MAIAPAYSSLHEQITWSLANLMMVDSAAAAGADDDDDAGLEADLKALRARVAALQDEDDVLAAESWDWAEGVEAVAQQAVERMAQEEEALSSSAAEAARVGVLRAYAEDVAAAARRLRETDLRRLAADAEAGEYSYILILTPEELAVAARMGDVAVRMEEWMASLAARLNRGAAEFAARPGEEAFVAAMRREAAKAEDARSALARCRAAAATGSSLPSPSAGDQMEMEED